MVAEPGFTIYDYPGKIFICALVGIWALNIVARLDNKRDNHRERKYHEFHTFIIDISTLFILHYNELIKLGINTFRKVKILITDNEIFNIDVCVL